MLIGQAVSYTWVSTLAESVCQNCVLGRCVLMLCYNFFHQGVVVTWLPKFLSENCCHLLISEVHRVIFCIHIKFLNKFFLKKKQYSGGLPHFIFDLILSTLLGGLAYLFGPEWV